MDFATDLHSAFAVHDLKVYSVMVTAIDFHDCIVCFGHSPLLFMFPCVVYAICLHSHFGIPMSLLDYYHVIPATPVRLGTMALPPLAGSAHSHRSLVSS